MVDLTPYIEDVESHQAVTNVSRSGNRIHAESEFSGRQLIPGLEYEYRVIDETGEMVMLEPILN